MQNVSATLDDDTFIYDKELSEEVTDTCYCCGKKEDPVDLWYGGQINDDTHAWICYDCAMELVEAMRKFTISTIISLKNEKEFKDLRRKAAQIEGQMGLYE